MYWIFLLLFILSLFFIPGCPYIVILSIYLGYQSEKHNKIRNIAKEEFLRELEEFENHKNKIYDRYLDV